MNQEFELAAESTAGAVVAGTPVAAASEAATSGVGADVDLHAASRRLAIMKIVKERNKRGLEGMSYSWLFENWNRVELLHVLPLLLRL